MDVEMLSAAVIMPLLMIIAAQGWAWVIGIFICLPIGLYVYYKRVGSKKRSRFFLSWGLISFFFLLAIFQLEVVPYLEIVFMENFVLMCFVAFMCLCIFIIKSYSLPAILSFSEKIQSKKEQIIKVRCETCSIIKPPRTYHCDFCGVCVHRKDHHNVWLDICIGSQNHRCYLGALIALLFSCIYSSNLTLTTICHPSLIGGILLLPDDCSDVFGDIHIALCFVSAVYSILIAVFAVYLLVQQLWLILNNTSYEEWKLGELSLHSNGFFKNIYDFFHGYL